jgi:putative transcriptional regulator
MTKKRNLFGEIMEGLEALAEQRVGRRTLRTHAVKVKPAPSLKERKLAKA